MSADSDDLQSIRKAAGATQAQMAEAMGMSPRAYQMLESGDSVAKPWHIEAARVAATRIENDGFKVSDDLPKETVMPAASASPVNGRAVILFVYTGDKGKPHVKTWVYPIFGETIPEQSVYLDDIPAAIAHARLLAKEYGRSEIQILYDDSTIVWKRQWQKDADKL